MSKPSVSSSSYALIENIYYSLNFISNYNEWIESKLDKFSENAQKFFENFEEQILVDDIKITKGIQRYPFGFKIQDKYRIYFSSKCGDNLPVYIIISAQELHLNNVWLVLHNALEAVFKIINYYDNELVISDDDIIYKLSRIDICNHNTFINLDNYIKPGEYNARTITKLSSTHPWIDHVGDKGEKVSYFRYGCGDVIIRFYNKIKEVCDMKYKEFFIPRWLDIGLIDNNTYDIYDHTYKLGKDYYLDFLFSNIYFSGCNNVKHVAYKIYSHKTKSKAERYDNLLSIIKSNKIKLCGEVINVEYQLRGNFLRTLKLKDDDGSVIDYTDIYQILLNIDKLYKYLTDTTFRVIPRKHNYSRKRDVKEMDPLWQKIHESKVLNIGEINLDNVQLDIYREYVLNMSKLNTNKKIVSSLTHLYYMKNAYDYQDIKDIDMVQLFNEFYNEYTMNESFYQLDEKLYKQLKRYGSKSK